MSETLHSNEIVRHRPVIVVDLDGVVFDTPQQAVNSWNELYGTQFLTTDIYDHNAVHDKVKFRRYHPQGKYQDDDGKFDDGFYDAQKDIEKYVLVPGAKEMLGRLKREYNAVIKALTARNPQTLREATTVALDQHIGAAEDGKPLIDELLFSGDPDFGDHKEKGEILIELGACVMAEDSVKNAESSETFGVPAILFAQPYNEFGHSWPPDKRATDWSEMYEMISKVLESQGYRKVAA